MNNVDIVTIPGTPREKDSIENSNRRSNSVKTTAHGFDDDVDEPLAKPKRQRTGYTSSPRTDPSQESQSDQGTAAIGGALANNQILVDSKNIETQKSDIILKTLEIVQDTAPKYHPVSETSSESRMPIPNSLDYSCSPDLQSNVPPRLESKENILSNQQTPPRRSYSMLSQSSPISADLLPRTPVINRKSKTPDPHRSQFTPVQQYHPTKIRKILVEYSTPTKSKSKFTIPYYNGPNGTPKTFKWLLEETRRRYIDRHDVPGKIDRLVNEEGEVLCSWDAIEHMIDENEKVRAI